MTIKVGDIVAIRGDKMVSFRHGKLICRYDDNQLVNGKYVKNTTTNGIWLGKIEKINKYNEALCGGGWRGIEFYEKIA